MVSVFQIYFDKRSEEQLDPAFIPFYKDWQDDYFENSVIKKVYEDIHLPSSISPLPSYIGITSWKQQQKSHFSGKEIIDRIEKDIAAGTAKDVYIYCPLNGLEISPDLSTDPPILRGIIKAPDMWHQHKSWGKHPFDADKLLNDAKVLPFDLFDGKWQYCHNNYFICKTAIFDEYCKTVLIPFMDFFNREDIKRHPVSVAWYSHRHEDKLYPSYSHVSEGLFGAFLAHSNYSFEYICKKKYRRKMEMIRIDGYEITNK